MSLDPFSFKPFWPSKDYLLQLVGSMVTLYAAFIGTTTPVGSVVYFFGCIAWNFIVWRGKLWGLVPLQVVGFFVSLHCLLVAFG